MDVVSTCDKLRAAGEAFEAPVPLEAPKLSVPDAPLVVEALLALAPEAALMAEPEADASTAAALAAEAPPLSVPEVPLEPFPLIALAADCEVLSPDEVLAAFWLEHAVPRQSAKADAAMMAYTRRDASFMVVSFQLVLPSGFRRLTINVNCLLTVNTSQNAKLSATFFNMIVRTGIR